MVNTQRPDDSFVNPEQDDVEGHRVLREGIGGKVGGRIDGADEDTEGHRVLRVDDEGDDDTEAHRVLRVEDEGDDTEGHRVLR